MSMDQAKKFFEALKKDRKAVEGLMGSEKPETEEGLFQAYAQAAAKLGFEASADEIRTVYEEIMKAVAAKTQESAGDVKELSAEELDAVAGGGFWFFNDKDHPNCKDTYKDRENCWVVDGCDKAILDYDGYGCAMAGGCSYAYSGECGNEAVEKYDKL